MNMSILIQAVQATRQTIDKRWIPEDFSEYSFFSVYDVWSYESENTKGNQCWACAQFQAIGTFFGDELRGMFPDLKIVDANTILPRVHVTLWDKDTCKCVLHRAPQPKAGKFGLQELVKYQ